MGLWYLIITFVIVIAIVGAIVQDIKKPKYKNQYHRQKPKKVIQQKSNGMNTLIKSILDGIFINKELKKLESQPNPYAVNKRPDYSGTVHPDNEGIIRWTKPFLRSLEWKRYEEVCMEYLKIKNCQADVTCIGADGGIDIKIKDSNGVLFAVAQCKAWNKPIGVNLIRELYGVMAADRVRHGIFLTTSEYTNDALEFAKGKNLLLIDSDELITVINGLNDEDKRRIDKIATSGDYTTPTCVRCNVKMVKRTAKTGKNAGNDFWGCANYPKCRNTMYVKANEY